MLRSLLVDFNSYFASVEQQARPELRGRPVGVVPMLADTTCLIAASYEAKKFGVKTLTKVGEAKQRIPDIALVIARHELYIDYHHRAVEIVDSIVPVREVLSIDEMDCELTGRWREPERALKIAHDVKAAIRDQLGECMRTSIGIGPNTFIAKTASNMQKPDGLTMIHEHELPQRLYALKPRDLTGIGAKMEQRLAEKGFTTMEQLGSASRQQLRAAWGSIVGEEFYEKLRGMPQYERDGGDHSIGHSHVLSPDHRNDADAYAIINRLTQKAAMRLRKAGYYARRLTATIKYINAPSFHGESRGEATQDTIDLLHALDAAWAKRPMKKHLKYLQVGVTFHDLLTEDELSGSLFVPDKPRKQLLDTLDKLNVKFGKQAAYFGGSHSAMESGKMAIAFNHIPDKDTEG